MKTQDFRSKLLGTFHYDHIELAYWARISPSSHSKIFWGQFSVGRNRSVSAYLSKWLIGIGIGIGVGISVGVVVRSIHHEEQLGSEVKNKNRQEIWEIRLKTDHNLDLNLGWEKPADGRSAFGIRFSQPKLRSKLWSGSPSVFPNPSKLWSGSLP